MKLIMLPSINVKNWQMFNDIWTKMIVFNAFCVIFRVLCVYKNDFRAFLGVLGPKEKWRVTRIDFCIPRAHIVQKRMLTYFWRRKNVCRPKSRRKN